MAIHLVLLTTCMHGFRNWKSPRFIASRVVTVSAMPDIANATALLYLSQPRTAISVLIPVYVLKNSGKHNIVPFWRGLAPPAQHAAGAFLNKELEVDMPVLPVRKWSYLACLKRIVWWLTAREGSLRNVYLLADDLIDDPLRSSNQ